MWAVREGSLYSTVVGNLKTDRIQRVSKVRRYQESTDKRGGGGSGRFTVGNQEGVWRRDLEGYGRGRRVTCGRVMLY